MIRMAVVLLLFVLLLGAFGARAEGGMTVLVYMSGSDLESEAGAATRDLEEMVSAMPADGSLRVLVLTGGALAWRNGIPADRNTLWEVTRDGLRKLEETAADSMGEAETLKAFLCRGAEIASAARTSLILWDHGADPLSGVCFDERAGQDSLSLDELTAALAGSPFAEKPLELIGFDACLMASVEVADALVPYAEYMAASQEPEPSSGWDYSFLSSLAETADGAEAGKLLTDCYAASLEDSLSPFTLSCIRLSAVPALADEIGNLFGALDGEKVSESYRMLASGRVDTKILGAASPVSWDLVDLQDYTELLEENGVFDAGRLRRALSDAVVSFRTNEDFVHGLSIYAPFDNKNKYTAPWGAAYDSLPFSESYQSFVRSFAREWMGGSGVSWQDESAVQLARQEQWMRLSTRLSGEKAADLAAARLLILEAIADNEYRLLWTSENLREQDGMLSADYRSEALYLTDDSGNIIDGPLTWQPMTAAAVPDAGLHAGRIATIGLQMTDLHGFRNVYLTWKPGKSGEYDLAEIYVLNPEAELFFPVTDTLKQGDCFQLGAWTRRFPESGAAFRDWDFGDNIVYCPVTFTGETGWHLKFLPLQSSADRYAVFEMTDLHANVHLSELIPIDNNTQIDVTEGLPQTASADGIEAALDAVKIFTGANACLELDLTVHNTLGRTVSLVSEALLLDDTVPGGFPLYGVGLDTPAFVPDESRQVTLRFSADDLRRARIEKAGTLRIYLSRGGRTSPVREYVCLEYHLPLYPGVISLPFGDEPEPVFSHTDNGVTYTVTDARREIVETYPSVVLDMAVRNDSDEDRWIGNGNLEVNGTRTSYASLLPDTNKTLLLPARSEIRYSLVAYMAFDGDEDSGEPAEIRLDMPVYAAPEEK